MGIYVKREVAAFFSTNNSLHMSSPTRTLQNKTKQSKQQKLPIFKELLTEDKNHEKQQSAFTDSVVEMQQEYRTEIF